MSLGAFAAAIEDFAAAWLEWMVHSTAQGTLVALAALLLARARTLFSPRIRHAFLVLAVLKLFVPPMLALPSSAFHRFEFGLQSWREQVESPGTEPGDSGSQHFESAGPGSTTSPLEPFVVPPSDSPVDSRPISTVGPTLEHAAMNSSAELAEHQAHGGSLALVLLAIWLVGIGIRWRSYSQTHAGLRRLLEAARPVRHGRWLGLAQRLGRAFGLGRTPRVLVTRDAQVPFACGLRRPTIVVPSALVGSSALRDAEALLAHELAHVRRRDLWINELGSIAAILFWFQPLLPWLRRELRSLREECCDDELIARGVIDARSYGDSLLSIARYLQTHAATIPAGAVCMSDSEGSLARRIRRALDPRIVRRTNMSMKSRLALLCVALWVLPGIGPGQETGRPGVSGHNEEGNGNVATQAPELSDPSVEARGPEASFQLPAHASLMTGHFPNELALLANASDDLSEALRQGDLRTLQAFRESLSSMIEQKKALLEKVEDAQALRVWIESQERLLGSVKSVIAAMQSAGAAVDRTSESKSYQPLVGRFAYQPTGAGSTGRGRIEGSIQFQGSPRFEDESKAGAGEGDRQCLVYLANVRPERVVAYTLRPARIESTATAFLPRITAVMRGQEVEFVNSMEGLTNFHILATNNPELNFAMPRKGTTKTERFHEPEMAIKVKSDVDPRKCCYIAVMENPFFATTDAAGSFSISDVPPGRHTLMLWNEKAGLKSLELEVSADVTVSVILCDPSSSPK